MTKIVVIGNGPSKEFFERKEDHDLVIGCNIPTNAVDFSVICDVEIIWVLKNNPKLLNVPVLLSTKAFEKLKELRMGSRYEVIGTFKPRDWHNSGHYATLEAVRRGATEVEIYGCDLATKDIETSSTTKYVPPNEEDRTKLIRKWRDTWDIVLDSNKNVHFTFYHE